MIRSFVMLGAALFLACTTVPEGLCDNGSGCLPGLRCEEGVCVGCGGDDECQAWEACTAGRRCELRAGMCKSSAQCETWEVCGDSYTCQLAEGYCLTAASCKAYEDCDGSTKKCVLQAGRCGTSSDCDSSGDLWAATCGEDNLCHSAPPAGNDVFIWGTLNEGTCGYDAVSSVMTPTRVRVGFDCYDSPHGSSSVISPDGRIYYRGGSSGGVARLKVFVRDAFKLEGKIRSYPKGGTANDTQVSTPGCAATESLWGYVVQAGTGSVAYNCRERGTKYYNLAGVEVAPAGYSLSAWNAADYMLAGEDISLLTVLTPTRTAIPVTGLPGDASIIDMRASSPGFWIAIGWSSSRVKQLWRIGHDGVATLQGTYGAWPENINESWAGVLDTSGALYSSGYRQAQKLVDVVVKRTPEGSGGTVVYSEDDAPALVNFSANYEKLFTFMHGSDLFRGP